VYGKPTVKSGPVCTDVQEADGGFLVRFKNAGDGLKTSDGGPVKGFAVAGPGRTWSPVEATIKGDTALVTCKVVEKPVAVRYAWEDNPEANLCNGEGLPAVPFRTDGWPRVDGRD